MKVGFYMNCVSAHQLPLAREVAKRVGADDFAYVDAGMLGQEFQTVACDEPWISTDKNKLDDCDIILTGIRDFEMFERRQQRGLATFYTSERWFKPISIGVGYRCRCSVPGWVRLLHPGYRKMARRFAHWVNADPHARYLAIGPWAKKDALKMGVSPAKIIDWGYFVAPSSQPSTFNLQPSTSTHALRVLWVGRMIGWKRVDTIIRAVVHANKNLAKIRSTTATPNYDSITLTLIGDGDQRGFLATLAGGAGNITFKDPMPMDGVRAEMRRHDVYVLSSNGEEGWGAALCEALIEGTSAVGTYEAGASSALLPEESLFHTGDYKTLSRLLMEGSACNTERVCGNLYAGEAAKELLSL